MNKYLLHGKLITQQPEELAAILSDASRLVSTAKGCHLYVISLDVAEPEAVFITEIWDSKEEHDQSLNIEGVRELIMKAMPLLSTQPTKGQELRIIGGTGI